MTKNFKGDQKLLKKSIRQWGDTNMKIMIFTEGTILMARSATGHSREEIVGQVKNEEASVKEYGNYISIKGAADKIKRWVNQGAEIVYLTSRREIREIEEIKEVLRRNMFPVGTLEYRKGSEEYKDVAERVMPDILVEDDCESIGGESEMTYPDISETKKKKIKSVVVQEFGGVDHLPDNIDLLGTVTQ